MPSSVVYRKKETTIWQELVYIYLKKGKLEVQVFSTNALHLQVEGSIISVSPVLVFKSFWWQQEACHGQLGVWKWEGKKLPKSKSWYLEKYFYKCEDKQWKTCQIKVLVPVYFQLPTRSTWHWAVLEWETRSALGLVPKKPLLGKKGIDYTNVSLDNDWEKTRCFFSNTEKENACIAEDTMQRNGLCILC